MREWLGKNSIKILLVLLLSLLFLLWGRLVAREIRNNAKPHPPYGYGLSLSPSRLSGSSSREKLLPERAPKTGLGTEKSKLSL